jgi:hypothetical protein
MRWFKQDSLIAVGPEFVLLDFVISDHRRAEIRNSRGHHNDIVLIGAWHNGRFHFGSTHDIDDVGASRGWEVCSGDKCDFCTTRQCLGRNCVTLLAR